MLSGCQKEMSIENGNGNGTTTPPINTPTTGPDSNYLSRFFYIYADPSGIDTTDNWIYSYDNLKRVTSLVDSTPDLAPIYLQEAYRYSYNGTDTVPYKTTHYYYSLVEKDTIEIWHYFDAGGKKGRDSFITRSLNTSLSVPTYSVNTDVSRYIYNGNTIFGIKYSPTTVLATDTATLDANGNLVSNTKLRGSQKIISTATFDNHPSPFTHLSNFKTFMIFPSGETFLEEFPQQNNLLHMYEVSTGINPHLYDGDDYTGHYIYKNNGYPQEILLPNTPTDYFKIAFVYQSL